ncbi:MAG: hypothetical protein KTR16_00455 [Acidiferrobacterales bacterium]|nr:hypothetical protein [Acidiferrobacterales bacterium]
MKDVLGYRKLFGVVGPSTNTVVQPDFDDLRVPGVTNHYSRIVIQNPNAISNESFMAGTLEIDKNTIAAVEGAMTCNPDHLVMGMSAVTFYGGAEGGQKWRENVEKVSGVGVTTGAQSLVAAIQAYGNIKKVAFISPYFPVANELVATYLNDFGISSVRDHCLKCPTWTAIAQVPPATLIEHFKSLDGDDVDALLQVGTNLSNIRTAAEAERWFGKPVIAINTATYWHALRSNGIEDKVYGFGTLMENY